MLPLDIASILSYVEQQTHGASDAPCVIESRRGFDVLRGWLAAVRSCAGLPVAHLAAAASLTPLLAPPFAAARYVSSDPPPLHAPAPPPAWTRAGCTAAARGGLSTASLGVSGAPIPRAYDAATVAATRPPEHADRGAGGAADERAEADALAVDAWAARAELVANLISELFAHAGSAPVVSGDSDAILVKLTDALAPCAVCSGVSPPRLAAAARVALSALGAGGSGDDDGGAEAARFAATHVDALLEKCDPSTLLWLAPRLGNARPGPKRSQLPLFEATDRARTQQQAPTNA